MVAGVADNRSLADSMKRLFEHTRARTPDGGVAGSAGAVEWWYLHGNWIDWLSRLAGGPVLELVTLLPHSDPPPIATAGALAGVVTGNVEVLKFRGLSWLMFCALNHLSAAWVDTIETHLAEQRLVLPIDPAEVSDMTRTVGHAMTGIRFFWPRF